MQLIVASATDKTGTKDGRQMSGGIDLEYPGWDSNPQRMVFETIASYQLGYRGPDSEV